MIFYKPIFSIYSIIYEYIAKTTNLCFADVTRWRHWLLFFRL